jgi:hypothetical protein
MTAIHHGYFLQRFILEFRRLGALSPSYLGGVKLANLA